MPWLTLPFNDPNIHNLERISEFLPDHFKEDYDHWNEGSSLVIFGPHGEFIEPLGGFILCTFEVYPFTSEKVAKLKAEELQKLKMGMIWDPTTVFTRKDWSHMKFSQLAGKRVVHFFESQFSSKNDHQFLVKLKERYLESRGTNDEFEVIHILEGEKKTKQSMQDLPWLVSLVSDLLPGGYDFYNEFYDERCCYGYSTLLAFDEEGNVVRRTIDHVHEDTKFPFYSGSVEEETLSLLINSFKLDYWNNYPNKGRIYTFHKKLRQPSCRNIIGSGYKVWSINM